MEFFRIQSRASDLNRLRKILTVISEAGGGFLIEKIRLHYLIPWSCRVHCFFHRRSPEACLIKMRGEKPVVTSAVLLDVLQKLGPTFVKLGQVLSLRADIVGEEIARELSKLQNDVAPFPYKEAEAILEASFGKPVGQVFKSVESTPVAAASLAQVHRAYLPTGEEVAVKIQRPGIRKIIEQDIHLLFYLANLIERLVPEWRAYQPTRVVKEFADWTLRELDFRLEGHNAERFRFAFKGNRHIKIPVIYWQYTVEKVLTMEFIHGVKIDDLERLQKLKINPRQLARHGLEAMFQQFLVDGFFHADPHPGNFFALPGTKICLHDFGMVGYLTPEQRRELVSCLIAFAEKNIDGYYKHILHLAITTSESNVEGFRNDVSAVLSEFFFSPNPPSVASAFFHIINQGGKNRISFPADLALFAKAIVTTEAMGLKLYPHFDFNKEAQPFVEKAWNYYLDPDQITRSLKADLFDSLDFLKTLPERTQTLFRQVQKGELSVKIDAEELFQLKEEFDRQNDVRLLGIVVVAAFFATLSLLYLGGQKAILHVPIGTLSAILFVILLGWFFSKVRGKPKK